MILRSFKSTLLLLLFLPASALAQTGLEPPSQAQVQAQAVLSQTDHLQLGKVLSGNKFTLRATGDTVRLAGIAVPTASKQKNAHISPYVAQSKAALSALIDGKEMHIVYSIPPRDAKNDLVGQIYTQDGVWVQKMLLSQGMAELTHSNEVPADLLQALSTSEHEAQQAHLGIWAKAMDVITPDMASQNMYKFRTVEGTVIAIHDTAKRGDVILQFDKDWKGKFSGIIKREDIGNFAALDPNSLVGKKIRIRGRITSFSKTPEMKLTSPTQIEIE